MGRPVLYMESMWSCLPSEILESKILPFLPIASLCRFRTVSKRWNTLISDPVFASAHARATSPEEHVLITVKTAEVNSGGWEVLDLANNTMFTISDDFLTKHVQQECGKHTWMKRIILAADGGLFFVMYSNCYDIPNLALLVCNPVLKTAKLLPPFKPGSWVKLCYESVAMSTDRVSMEYKIMVFHMEEEHYQTNSLDIYESNTGRWRTAVSSIQLPRSSVSDSWYVGSALVKLNSWFYQLYTVVDDQIDLRLVSYDEITGVGSDLGFGVPVADDGIVVESADLVVSKDRLFCVIRMGCHRSHVINSVKIFEVILASKECIECTEIPRSLLKWVLGDVESGRRRPRVVKVAATGCACCILFCSSVGRSVAYNLVDRSWYQYSDNKIAQAHVNMAWGYESLFCSNFCLSLCAP